MRILRLILGIIATIVVLAIFVETIEMIIIKLSSGYSYNYLINHQEEYFEMRNANWILVAKLIYTFLSSIICFWIGSLITKYHLKSLLFITVIFQSFGMLYAAFLSEFKETLPMYYWLVLIVAILGGFVLSYRWKRNTDSKAHERKHECVH